MSWQQRLINAQLRVLVKPRLKRLTAPERARRELDLASRWVFRAPGDVRHIKQEDGLHWIGVGQTPKDPIILYFHGGGYVAGSPGVYAGMLGRLSKLTGLEVCAPTYRLAPEHPAPAAFEDAKIAWQRLMDMGYRADRIILAGDSAGAGLALALLSWLCQTHAPPRAAVFFSPWTDLAMTGCSLEVNRDADPIFPVARLKELCEIVLDGLDPMDPRISPLYADFPDCPPVLLHWGSTEVLRDDSIRLAEKLSASGTVVETHEYPEVAHGWQLWDGWQPEARASLCAAAAFVQKAFVDSTR